MSACPIFPIDRIVKLYQSGLLAQELGRHRVGDSGGNDAFAKSCVSAHNEGRINLLSVVHQPAFLALDPHEFFIAQQVYCDTIPSLKAEPGALMECCRELVRRAGNDMAGSMPNGAFREWCTNHPAEAGQVIADAKVGKTPAMEFLTFALQGTNDAEQAVVFVEQFSDERRIYGMTALAQVSFPDVEAARSALAAIKPFTHAPWEDRVRANALAASFGVLTRHPDKLAAQQLVDAVAEAPGYETLHALAQLLSRRHVELDIETTRAALNVLRGVERDSLATVQQLSHALYRMLDTPDEALALDALANMLGSGEWSTKHFDIVAQKICSGPQERRDGVVVRWLLSENIHLGNAVPELARQGQRNGLGLEMSLPDLNEAETVFLCRKAVGFLFSQPRNCCSILVSVLRNTSEEARAVAIELLVNPLMMSYASVRDHLLRVAETDAAYQYVRQALDKYQQYSAALDAMEGIKELQPSEGQRHIVRAQKAGQWRDAMKSAETESVFHDLFHTSNVLHGRRTLTYFEGPDGAKRAVPMDLHQHSTTVEFPSLEWMDPVGLSHALMVFRVMKQS